MRLLNCRRCGARVEFAREYGRGPWYCAPRVKAKEVERIHARNVQDRQKRRAERDPLCRDCRQLLVFDDSGAKRDMHLYCKKCITKRKRSQDSRRVGRKPMAEIKREAAKKQAAKKLRNIRVRIDRQQKLQEREAQANRERELVVLKASYQV
jgi:hypothetical protein